MDLETAKELTATFVEVVVAPEFAPDALEELKKKKDLRLLDIGPTITGTPEGMDLKKVTGGLIYQDRDLGKIADVRSAHGGDEAQAHGRGVRGAGLCLEGLQAREVQRHRVRHAATGPSASARAR